MGLTHTQAQAHAPAMAYYIQRVDPKLTIGGVIDQLKKAPGDDSLAIVTAAWQVIRRMHKGEKIAFSQLTQQVMELHVSEAYGNHPAPASAPVIRPYQQSTSHQPVNPRLEPECPTHPGQRQTNCGGCRADQLAANPTEYPELCVLIPTSPNI